MPAGTTSRQVCAETGMLATDACPNVTSEIFDEGSEPSELCTAHSGKPLQILGGRPGADAHPEPSPRDLDPEVRTHEVSRR